jgi:hypothetical protein
MVGTPAMSRKIEGGRYSVKNMKNNGKT